MDKTDKLIKTIVTLAILAFLAVAILTMIMPKSEGAPGAGVPNGGAAGAPTGGSASSPNSAAAGNTGGGTSGNRGASAAGSGDAASGGAAASSSTSGSASSPTGGAAAGNAGGGAGGNRGASAAGSGDAASSDAAGGARSGSRGGNAAGGSSSSTNASASSSTGSSTGSSTNSAEARSAGGASGGRAPSAITVSAKTIGADTIRQIIKLNGDVSSQSAVNIYPETNGKIVRVLRKLGDNITRGSVIAYIDPSRPGQAFAQNPVLATVSGTITSLNISLGETVTTQTAVATIGSLGNLKVTVYVAEKYSAYLKMGLSAELSFTAAPGEKFQAVVSSISPVVNSKTRTIETVLTLIDKDDRIKQGMFAAVELVIREEKDTVVVPSGAIKDYNGTTVVYIVDNNSMARRMSVTLGLKNDSESQIIEGIQNGDRVITAGTVTDGSTVKIAEKSL